MEEDLQTLEDTAVGRMSGYSAILFQLLHGNINDTGKTEETFSSTSK